MKILKNGKLKRRKYKNKESQMTHAVRRAKERYGEWFDIDNYWEFVSKIKTNSDVIKLDTIRYKEKIDRTKYLIKFENKYFLVVFDNRTKLILTFLENNIGI